MSDTLPYPDESLEKQARDLEKNQQFAQAAELYRQAYEQRPERHFPVSRYLFCLRKINKISEAVEFGRTLTQTIRTNTYVHRELSWVLYHFYFKKIENEHDEDFDGTGNEGTSTERFLQMQKAAWYILNTRTEGDELVRKQVVFAMCKEAKHAEKWQEMYNFASQLDPALISKTSREWNGQQYMSDYQQWLYNMLKAAFELQRYAECLELARQGIADFPGERFFPWRQALAKKELGQIEEALSELESLNKRFQEWYIQRDIASLYDQMQQNEQAWLWYCKAACLPGKLDGRYKMFMAMALLLQRLERWQDAYEHLQLARMIVEERGWTRPATTLHTQITQFEESNSERFHPNTTPSDFQMLLRRLKALWQRDISATRPHERGTIKTLNERSGFIRTINGDYYFSLRDIPRHLVLDIGMEVEFELEDSYDQKKQRESVKAVRIRPVKRHAS